LAPSAHPRKAPSARSKKPAKPNPFEVLNVEISDESDTDFIDDESGAEETDSGGDSNVSVISNNEVCSAVSRYIHATNRCSF
jgi:hypothetical protein